MMTLTGDVIAFLTWLLDPLIDLMSRHPERTTAIMLGLMAFGLASWVRGWWVEEQARKGREEMKRHLGRQRHGYSQEDVEAMR
jgi:hypothetical protein